MLSFCSILSCNLHVLSLFSEKISQKKFVHALKFHLIDKCLLFRMAAVCAQEMFPKHLVGCDWASLLYGVLCGCYTGAGADFVMLGGMLAGHDQSGGEIIEENGKKYKLFYGMSSATAMKKYSGGVKDYRLGDSVSQLCSYSMLLQSIWRQVCAAGVSWRCKCDRSGYLGWLAFHLHLRWCRETQRIEQTHNFYQSNTTN